MKGPFYLLIVLIFFGCTPKQNSIPKDLTKYELDNRVKEFLTSIRNENITCTKIDSIPQNIRTSLWNQGEKLIGDSTSRKGTFLTDDQSKWVTGCSWFGSTNRLLFITSTYNKEYFSFVGAYSSFGLGISSHIYKIKNDTLTHVLDIDFPSNTGREWIDNFIYENYIDFLLDKEYEIRK